MSTYYNIRDFKLTGFSQELEDLNINHPHVIRRESDVIYRDEFAFAILNDLSPLLHEQDLEGWARSFYTLEGHLNSIMAYSAPDTPISKLNADNWHKAKLAVKNELRSLQQVRAFDVLTELDQIRYEQSSAAGYNYIGPKGPIGGDNHRRAIHMAKATLWSAIRDPEQGIDYVIRNSVPDVGYTRTQLTNLLEKTKVRGVWGRAFHYILLEGTAARPLLDAFVKGNTFLHIGEDPQLSVPLTLQKVGRRCKWLYAVDWSAFDSSVSRFEIDTAFDLIRERVIFPNKETELAFDISKQLFIHKKIAAPNGRTYWAHKGIPSGSFYTSIIGSLINRLRIEYLWRQIKDEGPKMCFTQGDDSLIGDDDLIRPKRLAEEASLYGWTINPDKMEYSTVPEQVTFLGRTMHGGLNSRSITRCIRLLVYPEYPVTSGRISAYRAAAIAQDSGGLSELLNSTARKLRRFYGIASEEEVPIVFKRYVP